MAGLCLERVSYDLARKSARPDFRKSGAGGEKKDIPDMCVVARKVNVFSFILPCLTRKTKDFACTTKQTAERNKEYGLEYHSIHGAFTLELSPRSLMNREASDE